MYNDLNSKLSSYIKELRYKVNKSKKEVADELKVDRNTYSKWEKEPISLHFDTLNNVVDLLGGNVKSFFQDYSSHYKFFLKK